MASHGPWLDIDLDALVRNARTFGGRVGVPLLPMVKANGYGLGATAVVRALEATEPWGFGVASLEEAVSLRQAGVARPIITFLPLRPDQIPDYYAYDVRPALGSRPLLEAWLAAGAAPFHLAVDTGMGRSGLSWYETDELRAAGRLLRGAPGYEGAFTHFHSADASLASVEEQWDRFGAVLAVVGRPPLCHAAASAAGHWERRFALDLARPGIYLYGGAAGPLVPEPVAALRAEVLAVRRVRRGDTVSYGAVWRAPADGGVATLGIGYADGVPRALGAGGSVGVGGREYPMAGRVTMDMVMVAGPAEAFPLGAAATVWGPGGPTLDVQAGRAGTISYELLTAVGPRVERRYGGMT
ncbi:MAG: alanine racemase [Gemmatimonadales bacterium]